jgi:dipeptidyl aminopeptidase/acylaminoacyl peptidase
MRFKKSLIGLGVVALLVIAALLPMAFRGKSHGPLVGPDLSELRYEEIEFRNGDLGLAGMMFVPEGEGPFPVAVIIHGSGTSRRASRWYLSVTQHLQDNGIAVLLPDKRGSEKSEGSWVGADFEDLAGDSLAAVEHVRRQERFADSQIGLIGMSQGGWIAPVAATRDQGISWVVSMSGPGVTAGQQLLHEEIHNISAFTWPFIARLMAPTSTRIIQKMDHVSAYADFDPIPYWKRVGARVFFAFGEGDTNVPVDDSVAVLRANLDAPLVKIYPDGGHGISDREPSRVQAAFLDDLVAFINQS